MNFVCDFGNSHPANSQCDCWKRYKCLPPVFRAGLLELYGKWVEEQYRGKPRTVLAKPVYPSDVTEEMRNKVLIFVGGTIPDSAYQSLEKRNLA